MRPRSPLSPEQARELDALERSLAGDPVDPDLRELEDLVRDVRVTAPQMSPGFAARLEHQVSEGFPASDQHPAPRRPRRWVLLPAGGVLAAALVAVVVVLGNRASDHDHTTVALNNGGALTSESAKTAPQPDFDAAGDGAGAASPPRAAAPATADGTARPGASAPSGAARAAPAASGAGSALPAPKSAAAAPVTPDSAPRRVQRSADLVLRVRTGKVESTSDGVVQTVDRFDGIVASSTISTDDKTGGEATFDLRIPTARLDDALAALSKLGHVAQRNQDLTDITSSFTSAEDRLSDARAVRSGLLSALGRAKTKREVDSLRARLGDVRSQIARLNGDLASLRRKADLSTVTVTVRGGDQSADDTGSTSGGGWSPGDAAHDALRVLEVIAGVALVALAILAPLALLGAIIALGLRAGRRRRRESALDPA
jgi:hypothetical protein